MVTEDLSNYKKKDMHQKLLALSCMKKLSKAQSYKEIGEYWDNHDLTEHWEETKIAKFEVDIQSEVIYYAIERELSEKHKDKIK